MPIPTIDGNATLADSRHYKEIIRYWSTLYRSGQDIPLPTDSIATWPDLQEAIATDGRTNTKADILTDIDLSSGFFVEAAHGLRKARVLCDASLTLEQEGHELGSYFLFYQAALTSSFTILLWLGLAPVQNIDKTPYVAARSQFMIDIMPPMLGSGYSLLIHIPTRMKQKEYWSQLRGAIERSTYKSDRLKKEIPSLSRFDPTSIAQCRNALQYQSSYDLQEGHLQLGIKIESRDTNYLYTNTDPSEVLKLKHLKGAIRAVCAIAFDIGESAQFNCQSIIDDAMHITDQIG